MLRKLTAPRGGPAGGGPGGGNAPGGGALQVPRTDAELLCRNGCGFFGNPEWQWYCSKCWRERQAAGARSPGEGGPGAPGGGGGGGPGGRAKRVMAEQKRRLGGRLKGNKGASSSAETTPDKERDKDVEKDRLDGQRSATEKHFRNLFGKGPQQGGGASPATAKRGSAADPPPPPEAPPEAKAISAEFSAFVKQRAGQQGVVDVSRQLKLFVDSLRQSLAERDEREEGGGMEEVSATAQEFYQALRRHLRTSPVYQGLSDDDQSAILDRAERYATVYCHKDLFCPPGTGDEEKDLQLQGRIRRLNWVSTKHLGCQIDESSQEVRDILHDSITSILEMDGKQSPQEKLEAVVTCCKRIFDMLSASMPEGSAASADEFLPCLIYVVLKSNPPRLHSNVNFISRFRDEEKLRMGESGYFFANLCCALSFVEQGLTAQSIGMDPGEFEDFLSGRVVPPGSWQSSLLMCESLQAMSQDIRLLADLRARHDKVLKEALELQRSMETFRQELHDEVEAVLERTKFEIRGPKKPVAVDEGSPPPKELPPPMAPANVAAAVEPKAEEEEEGVGKLIDIDDEDPKDEEHAAAAASAAAAAALADSSSAYKGFSAQSFAIPSISCNNASPAKKAEKKAPATEGE